MGQILDQKIPTGFNFCTFGWSHGKQKYICGYSTTASASAFQAEDVGSIPITRSFNKPIAQLGRATLLKCFLGKKINRNYYLAVNPCVIGSNPIRFIENFGVVVQLVETHLA